MAGMSFAARNSRSACSRVRDLDGRLGCPLGRSHSRATLRLTRSRAWARRIDCRRMERRRLQCVGTERLGLDREPVVDLLGGQFRKTTLAESGDDVSARQACPVSHGVRVPLHKPVIQPGLERLGDCVGVVRRQTVVMISHQRTQLVERLGLRLRADGAGAAHAHGVLGRTKTEGTTPSRPPENTTAAAAKAIDGSTCGDCLTGRLVTPASVTV